MKVEFFKKIADLIMENKYIDYQEKADQLTLILDTLIQDGPVPVEITDYFQEKINLALIEEIYGNKNKAA